MLARRLNKEEREHHLAKVSRFYLTGTPQYEIGRQLGVVDSQISYDLKVIQKRWQQSQLTNYETRRARELARINTIEREAWEGWRRSQQGRETSITEQLDMGDQTCFKTQLKKEGQVGDPRFLATVLRCVEERCKIFGLYA